MMLFIRLSCCLQILMIVIRIHAKMRELVMTVSMIISARVLQDMKEGIVNLVGSILILSDNINNLVTPFIHNTIIKELEWNFEAFYVFSQPYKQIHPFYL